MLVMSESRKDDLGRERDTERAGETVEKERKRGKRRRRGVKKKEEVMVCSQIASGQATFLFLVHAVADYVRCYNAPPFI